MKLFDRVVAGGRRRFVFEGLESRAYFAGVGQGLVADYYSDQALANLALARTDATVNFAPTGSPGGNVPAHKYSVRWTGQLLPQYSQTYTIYASSIGGVRVWVNGQKIIDNWTSHSTAVENKATVALTAGSYVPIQIDYREDGKATMKLSWSSSSQAKQIIPRTQLYRQGSAPIAGGWLEGNIGEATGSVQGTGATAFNLNYSSSVVPPPTSTINLRSSADSYVRDGSFATQNFGAATDIVVKKNTTSGYTRNGLLKFDLSGVTSASAIGSAKLQLFRRLGTSGSPVTVNVYASSNTSWTEAGVNWNNQPAAAALLGSFTVLSTTASQASIDVTSFLKSEKSAGHNFVTFVLKSAAAHDPNVLISSDESATNRPNLQITPAAVATPPVSVDSIGGNDEASHFLYKSFRGDAVLVAKVNPVASATGEEGLIVRDGLATGDAFAGLVVKSDGVRFESLVTADGPVRATSPISIAGPVFLKLVKDGNSYAGYLSATGADGTWQLVGTVGTQMSTFQLMGLVASGAEGTKFTAGFSAVSLKAVNALGGNLNSQSDRVQDLAFVDLVKTTRGFYNTAGRTASNGFTDFATTDSNGWPTEDFSFTAVDNSEWNIPVDAGTYKTSFTGPAGVTVTGSTGVTIASLVYNAATQTYTADVIVAQGAALKLTLTFASTQGQVKNIRLLQPGYALSTTQVFTDKYVNLVKTVGPSVLRFMDWTKTNGKQDVNWSDRPKTTDATQAHAIVPGDLQPIQGIAWEYVVQFANLVGKNVWINVPEHASHDYIIQLATLLRDGLNPDINIYVEDSNEVWNNSFEQGPYNKTQAVNEVFANPNSDLNYDHKPVDTTKPGTTNPQADTWGDRRHARRTKEISDVFRQVFTAGGQDDPINTRVRVILGGQVSSLSRFDNELLYLESAFGATAGHPKNYIYGIGVAPYFDLGTADNQTNLTPAQVLAALNKGVDVYVNGASLTNTFARANDVRWAGGLHVVAYEGGPKTFGENNIAAKRTASLDPAMQGILVRYLNNWYAKGGELFNYYTIGGRSYNSPFGTWSITEDQDILNSPKILGYEQVRDALPVSTTVKGVYA